jgi:hypothetical protein
MALSAPQFCHIFTLTLILFDFSVSEDKMMTKGSDGYNWKIGALF